jgi:DNA-binding SARP family transcriptional activator/Flp pilus assembly protein TadD
MIRLRTLGALDLRAVDGEELRTVLAQPKRFALLAYLAVATPRGAHQRDTLIALFWPEQDSEHARNALSQSLHFLRRWLGAGVIISRGADELAVNRDLLWCDAVAFEDALAAGQPKEALELYRGDLLHGFHLSDDAVEFQHWLERERERLMRREVSALEAVAKNAEEVGDFAGAVSWWQRLAARDPYSSRIALGLMRAFEAAGDPGAAVRHARVHETLLKNELDLAPDPEVGAFGKRLRSKQVNFRELAPTRSAAPETSVDPTPDAVEPQSPHTESWLTNSEPRFFRRRRTTVLVAGLAALCATAVIASVGTARDAPAAPSRTPRVLQVPSGDASSQELRVVSGAPAGRPGIGTSRVDSTPTRLYLHELVVKARYAEANRSLVGLQTAMQAYRRAIAFDSTYAPAYAGLSSVYDLMAEYNYAPGRPALDTAYAMAKRAVALDSTLPEARTAVAVALANAGHFEAAEREFRRAIELGPANAGAHYRYSVLLIALGRGQEALVEAEQSLALDHFASRGPITMKRWAVFLLTGQRPHKQLPVRERQSILRDEPGEPWARAREAMDFAEEGRCAEARASLEDAERLVPRTNLRMIPFVGSVLWRCGERDQARQLLRELKRQPEAREEGLRMAWLHAQFGERDSAFVWLQHHRWSVVELAGLSANEAFDSLRTDPRLPELLRRLRARGDAGRTSIP